MQRNTAEASAEAVKKRHENNRCFTRKDAAVNSFSSSRSHTEQQHQATTPLLCVYKKTPEIIFYHEGAAHSLSGIRSVHAHKLLLLLYVYLYTNKQFLMILFVKLIE